MKNFRIIFIGLIAMAFVATVFEGCSSDDNGPSTITLTGLTAGAIDLNGATAATTVPVDAPITATFSTDVDATTATDANILLTRDFDGSAVAKSIVASGKTVTITPSSNLFSGDQYKITLKTGLKSANGKSLATEIVRSFGTPGIGLGSVPQSASQVLYIQFDNSVIDLTGNATVASEKLAYTSDRFGTANSAANFRGASAAGEGDLVELSGNKLMNASMTLSVWIKINNADYVKPGNKPLLGLAANNGYFVEVGDGDATPEWLKFTTSHLVNPDPQSHGIATSWWDFNKTTTDVPVTNLFTTAWHQLTFTYDATSYMKTAYFDGVKVAEINLLDAANNEWNLKDMTLNTGDGIDAKLALGYFVSKANTNPDWANFSTATNTYKGYMDDLRLFNKSLSASEVTTLYNSEKP